MTFYIPHEWKKAFRRLWWLLLLPAALILKELAAAHPIAVQTLYVDGMFPAISSVVSWIFGWLPFSFAEFMIYALLILLGVWIVYAIVKAVRKQTNALRLFRTLTSFAIVACAGIFSFYFLWGFNYFRPSVAYSMGLELKEREPQQLADLCVALTDAANTLREQVDEDENGIFTLPDGNVEALGEIPAAYAALGREYAQFACGIPRAKPVAASELMSAAGISGIFIPFTEEANVNVHQSQLLLPVSAAHESAHLMGIAREDEANFIGYLACIRSQDPSLRYSGVMLALIHAGNALNKISPGAYSQLYDLYSDSVKRDLRAYNAYWDQYKGRTQETVTKINDNYLKQQHQDDGVMSYGRMVDLLLAYYSEILEPTLA